MICCRVPLRASPPEGAGGCTRPRHGGYNRPPYGCCGRPRQALGKRLPWPRVAYSRRSLLTGAVPVCGLAGPVPLWGGHARPRTEQPVFCKSHTCPVGTAGAEGPPSGGLDGPQGLATGGSRPGASPPDHPDQPWAQSRPATGLTELRLSTCQKSEESVVNWVCNQACCTRSSLRL